MSINEITYLLLGLGGGFFFSWLYLKYKFRNMPSVLELLDKSKALAKEMHEAIDGQKATIKHKEKELDMQLSNLSKKLED